MPIPDHPDGVDENQIGGEYVQITEATTTKGAWALLCSLYDGEASQDVNPPLVPESLISGFLVWLPCLFLIAKLLPPIMSDVADVIANIVDLYLTTVFRLCTGSAKHEKTILGIDVPTQQQQLLVQEHESVLVSNAGRPAPPQSQSPLFSFGRKGNNNGSKLSLCHKSSLI